MQEFRSFFRTRWVELLIAGVWLQSVVGAAFTGSWVLLAATALGGLGLLALVFWLVDRLHRRQPPTYGDGEAFGVPRQAVLFTVGMQPDTIQYALQRQRPQWLGLVCSRRSREVAADVAAASGLDADHVQLEIVDPWNVD